MTTAAGLNPVKSTDIAGYMKPMIMLYPPPFGVYVYDYIKDFEDNSIINLVDIANLLLRPKKNKRRL